MQTALAIKESIPDIVQRYANGESIQTIAAENGVHRATLYRWMLSDAGDAEYHKLVTDCLVNRVCDADTELDGALTVCDIARAREKARFSRMDLERRRPALYGQKSEVKHSGSIAVDDRLGRARERVIEGALVAETPNAALLPPVSESE